MQNIKNTKPNEIVSASNESSYLLNYSSINNQNVMNYNTMFYNHPIGNNCTYNSAIINNNWPNQFVNPNINENNILNEKKSLEKCNIKNNIKTLKNNQKKFNDSPLTNIENQKVNKKISSINYETNIPTTNLLTSYNINPSTSNTMFISNASTENNILSNQQSLTKDQTFVCEWVTVR